jgi:hypothetical protein
MNVWYFMSGAVAGYSKKHYYLGTPEERQERKQKGVRKIMPRRRPAVKKIKPL